MAKKGSSHNSSINNSIPKNNAAPLPPTPTPPPTPVPTPVTAPTPSAALPPRPPTPGVVSAASMKASFLNSAFYRYGKVGYAWKRSILFGLSGTYALYNYQSNKLKARERDFIHDNTYLYWKIYDGSIVEAKSTGSGLNYLLNSSQGGSPEEPPRVQTLFEVIRTIKFIEADDRIRGLVADFSKISVPSVPSYSLGLAQLEEIQDALLELRRTKREKFGKDGWRSVAWTDSFSSQGQYLFASTFDEVFTQPTGGVPLVGMSSTIPFYSKLLGFLGIEVYAEARNEYKSFVQPYIGEGFTEPQRLNKEELLNDLNDNLMTYIARNRFPGDIGQAGLNKVKELSKNGPYTAREAVKIGLLDGLNYRSDIMDSVLEKEKGGDPARKMKGFYHYSKVVEQAAKDAPENTVVDVGVVYLQGTIGDSGEFGTAAVVRGLKEAGEDDKIGAVVLRLDTGGGGVVESDTIWAAVRDLKEKHGKTVIASFGNASASGGYLVSTHVDAIMAAPSTITGSIGVASLRPTITQKFFDRIYLAVESSFTGSKVMDPTHSLTPAEKARSAAQVDEMYVDFKNRVVEGRGVHPEVIDLIAGGRVFTGLKAFSLTAPPELIRKIRGLNSETVTLPISDVLAIEPTAPVEGLVATISEDQETSPFAPPVSTDASTPNEPFIPTVLESISTATATTAAIADLSTSVSAPVSSQIEEGSVLGKVAGEYEIVAGAFGKGIIDGLGGIRDSAVYACELYLAKGIAEFKINNPTLSEEDALRSLLPDAVLKNNGEGLALQIDVQLKRFPVQKSFFQQFQEQARRGDMDVNTITSYMKISAVSFMNSVLSMWTSAIVDDLGLSRNASNRLGIGKQGSTSAMRAEVPGYNIR